MDEHLLDTPEMKVAELAEAAAEARAAYVKSYKANLRKIEQLATDAEVKKETFEQFSTNWFFYDGVATGLRRACMVLEGRG